MKSLFNNLGEAVMSLLLAMALALPVTISSTSQAAFASEPKQTESTSGPSYETADKDSDKPAEKPVPELEPTQVDGLIMEKSLLPTSSLTNTIVVSPANGRTVELQKQLSSGSWKTIATYTTANEYSAAIKIKYPAAEWKTKKFTTWRLSIPETTSAQAYTSESILLYTKNRSTVSLYAKSAIVMNASTGRILYSKNMNTRRPQASITKVMTAILAIENNKLSKKVKIKRAAANTPWTYVPMKKGNRITIKDLLYAALLPSSNGSATALAQSTSGTRSKFVKLMNKKASELGMSNTHYVNAHGLTAAKHYSSAYDTAVLMRYAIQNKTFKKIIGTRIHTFVNYSMKKRYVLISTNKLLKQNFKGVVGGKTGTTDAAGCCFACVYQHKDQTYITVVLGCKYTNHRFSDTKRLFSYIKKYGW